MAKRPRRPARYHHGNLREAALAEAASLVDEGGPDALGLRELGRRLGVSHAAVHHHFPSVEGLALELSARWFGDLDRAMTAAAEQLPPARPLDRFRALGVGYVRYALAHPQRYRLQFRGGPNGLVPEADASFARVRDAVVACIAHRKDKPRGARSNPEGVAEPIDPLVTTILAWSAMHGLALLWIDGAFRPRLDRAGVEALVERVARLIARLLEP